MKAKLPVLDCWLTVPVPLYLIVYRLIFDSPAPRKGFLTFSFVINHSFDSEIILMQIMIFCSCVNIPLSIFCSEVGQDLAHSP